MRRRTTKAPPALVVVMDECVGLPEATTAYIDSIVRGGRAVAVSAATQCPTHPPCAASLPRSQTRPTANSSSTEDSSPSGWSL